MTFQPGDRVERTAHGRDEWPLAPWAAGTVCEPFSNLYVDVKWDNWERHAGPVPMAPSEIKLIGEEQPK